MNVKAWPLFAFERARSIGFTTENLALRFLAQSIPGGELPSFKDLHPTDLKIMQHCLNDLLRQDSERIAQGYYPMSVLKIEEPWTHFLRVPSLLWDGIKVSLKRKKGRTTTFSEHAYELAQQTPRYYRRNFHFQTDGYLSESSAELYEHQVELLFGGGADAMRRLILKPMAQHFHFSKGLGLRFLEIGAGTGRTSRFVKLLFPKAQIVVSDLSSPYLQVARRKLEGFEHLSFVECQGENLPFKDQVFDAVYSSFVFHELPLLTRKEVMRESLRVIKPGGFLGWVDSLQLGDNPKLDKYLLRFPEGYHEPFYRNYIETPLEQFFTEEMYTDLKERLKVESGFFSKAVSIKV